MAKDLFTDTEVVNHIEDEGQLAIDVYQTDNAIVVVAPIAGVDPSNLEIAITDEVVSVRGHRHQAEEVVNGNYFIQECYWGSFSRSYSLPCAVDPDRAEATLVEGLLKITIPRIDKSKTRFLKVTKAPPAK